MRPILILGGYGNFGKRIATQLAQAGYPVRIAGRNLPKANQLANQLCSQFGEGIATPISCNIEQDLPVLLPTLKPAVVIHTCGPFQGADYHVAEQCLAHGIHYIDLADGRDYVCHITQLNAAAQQAGVCIISGASTVPALSSAVIDHVRPAYARLTHLTFGISPGQKAERGLATTQGILSYVGKPLTPYAGHPTPYGWQNLYRHRFPDIGSRWMANGDIPDLDLFPTRYGLKSIRFSAGLELSFLHLGLWALGWLVRLGLPLQLPRYASLLWRTSNLFDALGSADGGMFLHLQGINTQGTPQETQWHIIAKAGDGPHIPTIPAILLAQKLSQANHSLPAGAYPCVGLIPLADYLAALSPYAIRTISHTLSRNA